MGAQPEQRRRRPVRPDLATAIFLGGSALLVGSISAQPALSPTLASLGLPASLERPVLQILIVSSMLLMLASGGWLAIHIAREAHRRNRAVVGSWRRRLNDPWAIVVGVVVGGCLLAWRGFPVIGSVSTALLVYITKVAVQSLDD
jgi:hypothetical protein